VVNVGESFNFHKSNLDEKTTKKSLCEESVFFLVQGPKNQALVADIELSGTKDCSTSESPHKT